MALKILLVDDNPGELRFLRTFFSRHPSFEPYSVRILEATDGEEAFELFLREKPDLSLVDLLLPKMDGVTLCAEIRRHQGQDEAALLAMSSIYRDDEVARQLREDLNVELLGKPLDMQHLPEKVLRLLERRSARDGSAAQRWATPTAAVGAAPEPAPSSPAAGSAGEESQTPRQASVPAVASSPAPAAIVDLSTQARGTLDSTGLPVLLAQAADQSATGALRLSRGKLHKVIYFRQGRPMFVDSNVRNETLGAYLLSKRIIDEEVLTRALKHSRVSNRKLGESLVDLGAVDQQVIDEGLKAQARLKIATALRWEDGAFVFAPGDDFSNRVPDCSFDALPLVLATLARLRADPAGLLQSQLDHVVALTPLGQRQIAAVRQACGEDFVAVAGKMLTVGQLAEAAGDGAGGLACLHSLRQCQLVEFRPPESLRPDRGLVGQTTGQTGELALDSAAAEPGSGLRHLMSPSQLTSAETLIEPGTGEADRSGAGVGRDTIPSAEAPPMESGASTLPDAPTVGPPPEAQTTESTSRSGLGLTEWVERKLAVLERQNYYELLEVPPTSTAEELELALGQLLERCDRAVAEGADTEMCQMVGEKLRESFELLADAERRGSYDDFLDAAVTVQPAARQETLSAALLFREGQVCLRDQRFEAAVEALQKAVEASPEQPDYLALYGWAIFKQRGEKPEGAVAARPHMQAALQLSPDSPQINEWTALVALGAGEQREAVRHLQAALKFGPLRQDLYEMQRALLEELAEYEQLERLYRNMIYRLSDQDQIATLPFWVELGSLYLNKLGQPGDGRLALSVAQKLAPDDPRVIEALEGAEVLESTDWAEACGRLVDLVAAEPADARPLHELFAAYQRTAQPERQLVVASILTSRGQQMAEQRAVMARLRPRALVRREAFSLAELSEIRDASDSPLVERVVAVLSDLLCDAFPVPLEALGSATERSVTLLQLPESCASTFAYLAEILGVQVPEIYVSTTLSAVVPRPERESALVVAESLLRQSDQRPLAFAAAQALSCMSVGRRHVFARSGNDLKTAFLAGLSACQPGMPVSDPTGAVAELRERIKQDAPRLEQLGEALRELFAAGLRINLSDWMRGVRRTASRIGLLACGDTLVALQQVVADPPTAKDLVGFALSRQVGSACSDIAAP